MIKPPTASDPAGLITLENLANAPDFNKWLFDAVAPYCKGTIIEIGSGIGNIGQYLLQYNKKVTLTDLREEYCTVLNRKFGEHPHLDTIKLLDISSENFEKDNLWIFNKYDTVIALNVVEHIENDKEAVNNCKKLLTENGRLILLVPAYQSLYNSLDKSLDHCRRYNTSTLSVLLQQQGMEVTHSRYFNFAGIFGWWFTGNLLQRKIIPVYQISIFNMLIPVFKLIDRIVFYKAGLSVIVVGRKLS